MAECDCCFGFDFDFDFDLDFVLDETLLVSELRLDSRSETDARTYSCFLCCICLGGRTCKFEGFYSCLNDAEFMWILFIVEINLVI